MFVVLLGQLNMSNKTIIIYLHIKFSMFCILTSPLQLLQIIIII